MVSKRTYDFLVAATLLGGILAGINIDRAIVAIPAWKQVGAVAWAAFSEKADLGNGLFLYPLVAIGGALLNIGAVLSYRLDRVKSPSHFFPLSLGALLAIGGLLVTVKAAPIMLGVPHLDGDPSAIQKAFDGFNFWGGIRGFFQIGAFAANLWSLSSLNQRTDTKNAKRQ
jgi:hypothetical protein